MANKCCLCSKDIPFYATDYALSEELYKKRVCDECLRVLDTVRKASEPGNGDAYYAARKKLEGRLDKITDQEVVRFCKGLLLVGNDYFSKVEEQKKRIQNHLQTTGFNFEGFRITKYNGIVNGEAVLGAGILSDPNMKFLELFKAEPEVFSEKITEAREAAIIKLIEESIKKGGNAVIGIKFDYIAFSNNIIGVVASATSVIVEAD